jgi:hypothetical protein
MKKKVFLIKMEEFPLKIDKNNDQITIYDLAKHQNHGYECFETRRLLEKYLIKEVNIKIKIKKKFCIKICLRRGSFISNSVLLLKTKVSLFFKFFKFKKKNLLIFKKLVFQIRYDVLFMLFDETFINEIEDLKKLAPTKDLKTAIVLKSIKINENEISDFIEMTAVIVFVITNNYLKTERLRY